MAPAWVEQCRAVGVLSVVAVLLNWVSTGDHLVRSLREGNWPVAGMDIFMLVSASIAVIAGRKLSRHTAVTAVATAHLSGATATVERAGV